MREKTETMKTPNMPWLNNYPAHLDWTKPVKTYPIYDALYETAAKFGDRPAFDFMGKKSTWNDVRDLVDRMAHGLQKMGVTKGSKVGIFLPNCMYFLVSYYAILRAGGTVVNFNPLYVHKEVQHHIEDSETDIMITVDLKALCDKMEFALSNTRLKKVIVCSFAGLLPFPKSVLFPLLKHKDIAGPLPENKHVWFDDVIDNEGKPAPIKTDINEDVALLQYTGGTTGVPKAAMLTHANVSANTEQVATWFDGVKMGEEKVMGVLPFFHVFAMAAVMNFGVRNGLEIVALPRFELDATLKSLSKNKPHYFPAVPAIFNAINNHPKLKKFDLSGLRYCIGGGAPVPVTVKKSFEANTGCTVVEGYGLSEASPVLTVNPTSGPNIAGSIGMPLPNTIIEILDMETGQPAKLGERGELCARGPQVMKGYWKKPDETAKVMKEGRLHTGDVAIMDENGYFYIVDRIKDMIITNGYNVYPRNVEDEIYKHPAVEECIVAGWPDDARGEVVRAWIRPKADRTLTAEDMKKFLEDKVSPIEMPRNIIIRSEPLPKTMVGKLSRKDLLIQEKAKEGVKS